MTRRRRRITLHDPDPRRRSRRRGGPRRGIEPAGLKRWRLSHRRTHDPGYIRTVRQGRRGGSFFAGPHKRRYDPGRRFGRLRERYRRHAPPTARGKLERGVNRYGWLIGILSALSAGIWKGHDEYLAAYGDKNAWHDYGVTITGGKLSNGQKRTPEISKVWGSKDDTWGGGSIDYLKYKFLGLDTKNNYIGSAWALPFIVSLIATVAGPIARLFTNKGQRILKPISKIGMGGLAISTIGALALPGTPPYTGQTTSQPNAPTQTAPYPKAGASGSTSNGL